MLSTSTITRNLLLLFAGLFLLNSCGVTVDMAKRQHQPGFYFNVSTDQPVQSQQEQATALTLIEAESKVRPLAIESWAEANGQAPLIEKQEVSSLNASDVFGGDDASNEASERSPNAVAYNGTGVFPVPNISSGEVSVQPVSEGGQGSAGKSQLVALLLAIFVGALGIHRFYLGYTTIGIIQLLTGGGCGIWALIDLVRIITGDLQPKDGPYDETF